MSKIDVVIPTHNRTNLLKRILDYYKLKGADFNFIIADSSTPENKAKNKKLINQYSNLKILYLDKFSPVLEQHYKFAEMVKYIKSRYCVFCADDDFVVPNAIRECINFLEKNPDYSVAHGTYISFCAQKGILGFNEFKWRVLYSPQSITYSEPNLRLASHLKNYGMVLWGVRRSDIVKSCYKELMKTKIDPYLIPILGELLPDALTAVYGKIKNLDTFYGARQYLSQIRGSYPSLIDAKKAGKYNLSYSNFKNCLLNNLEKESKTSISKADAMIDSYMENFIKFSFQEHLVNKVYTFLGRYPAFITQILRFLHTSYLFSKPKISKIGLIDQPSSKYFQDFENIRRNILEHTYE